MKRIKDWTLILLWILVCSAAGAATTVACATIKTDAAAAKTAIVDCAKADAGPILSLVAHIGAVALASQINGGQIDWPAIEGSALVQGKVVGGCALSRFVAALAGQPKTEARALMALPDPAVEGQAAVARLSAKFDGAVWR